MPHFGLVMCHNLQVELGRWHDRRPGCVIGVISVICMPLMMSGILFFCFPHLS